MAVRKPPRLEPWALQRQRHKMKLTQAELAKRLGVDANTLARWERGERAIPPYLVLALRQLSAS